MEIYQGELSNGLKIIYQQVGLSKLSHIGLFIDVGTRDETKDERGVAHFLEHVLFKGTSKRKAFHILGRIDNVGGEINAYTTKEETVVYSSVMIEHTARAMDLIADIIFNSVFPQNELEKEKDVVIDEIQSYLDTPFEMVFEDFETMIFKNHPLENDILGNEDDVKKITKQTILNFVKKHYIPQKMVLSYTGGMSLKKFLKLAEKCFGEYSSGEIIKRSFFDVSTPNQKIVQHKSNFQCHAVIGGKASSYYDENRLALSLLNNYLGGPAMNSRLNMVVREKHGITYNIESNLIQYRDTGMISVYFGTDALQLPKAKKLVLKEIDRLKKQPLGTMQLHYAKQQLNGYIALSAENPSGLMMTLGKSKMIYDDIESIESILDKISKINSKELQDLAQQYFDEDNLNELFCLIKE